MLSQHWLSHLQCLWILLRKTRATPCLYRYRMVWTPQIILGQVQLPLHLASVSWQVLCGLENKKFTDVLLPAFVVRKTVSHFPSTQSTLYVAAFINVCSMQCHTMCRITHFSNGQRGSRGQWDVVKCLCMQAMFWVPSWIDSRAMRPWHNDDGLQQQRCEASW